MLDVNENYKHIARRIVEKYPHVFREFNVDEMLFLVEDTKKPKNKYADIKKVSSPYDFVTNIKFIVTIYEGNIEDFSTAQEHIMIMRELMKIDDNFEKLRKYDLNDFKLIVDTYGSNWDSNDDVKDPLS